MTTKELVLTSLEPVVDRAQYVSVRNERISELAKELLNEPVPPWNNELQFLGTPEETAQYYFFLDSLNFCFWGEKGKTRWEYPIDGEWVGGYYAFSRAIKDAFLRNQRLFDAGYVRDMPQNDFEAIFSQGRNELLLMLERWQIVRENFGILADRYSGSAISLLERANRNADVLVALLRVEFPTFDDSAVFDGHRAIFLKRAQIFCSDLSFTGLPELAVDNLDHLTAFADYKLPQLFESFGVLEYAPKLKADIIDEQLIPAGSREEIELRACSVVATQRLRGELEQLGRRLTANELDWILWVKAKATHFAKPHHKTLTMFY